MSNNIESKIKIEILYPDLCTLYGDKGNMKYLQQVLPEAEFFETDLNSKPLFLSEEISLCYICSMSEQSQEVVLDRLMKYKDEICDCFDNGNTLFFFTGNGVELLGKYIEREDGSRVEGLGYLDSYSVRQSPNRFNTLMQARFNDMTLLGYSSRFSHTFGISEQQAFCQLEIGSGMNADSKYEGYCSDNIIATYMLGPLLVANPEFTKYLVARLGVTPETIPYEDAMKAAYDQKYKEFQQANLQLN